MNKIKLVIIYLLLIFLIIKIPLDNKINNEIEITEVITNETQISSRSLDEPRTEEIDNPVEEVIVNNYSEELVNFIKQTEGFSETPYIVEGETYFTIGFGHHGTDIKETDRMTEEEADRLLRAELDGTCTAVLKYMSYLDENMTQGQLDALVSFTYNGGLGMLQELTNYKKRNLTEMAEHIKAYTNGGMRGLIDRRAQEYEMFISKGEN